ncbi:hypothetical protein [Lacinutrix undariae]
MKVQYLAILRRPGEGAINGGQGGAVYTQNCVDTGFLGLGKPKKFIHTFSV